jgi:hypothetical protein
MVNFNFSNAALNIGKIDINGAVRRRIARSTMENIVIPGMERMVRDINNNPTPFANAVMQAVTHTQTVQDLLDTGSALYGALGIGPSTGHPETVHSIIETIGANVRAKFIPGGQFPAIVVGIVDQEGVNAIVNHSSGVYTSSSKKNGDTEIPWLKWLLFGFNDPIAYKVGFNLSKKGVARSRTGIALMFPGGNFSIEDWTTTDPHFVQQAFESPIVSRKFGQFIDTRLRRNMREESDRFEARFI